MPQALPASMDVHMWRTIAAAFALCVVGFNPDPALAQGDVTVRVTVLRAGENAPVVRANVVMRRDDQQWGASTDTNGVAQLSVPPGKYRLGVSAIGYSPERQRLVVAPGRSAAATVRLSPTQYGLNEIVIRDDRGRSRATSTVQRIDPQSIERQDAADVSELASLVPATHVQTNSRGQTILYFRNAGDRQVGQFFDGALLNIPWDNRVDISLIPASVVEEITVTKGVPSVRYGANVLGGAINFQSRTLDALGQQTEVKAALGTAEQRRATVTHLGRTGRWNYTAAVQYAARGNQPLPRDADLEYNQPISDRRINTDRRLVSGFGRASYRFADGGQLGLSLLHVDAEQGVAPEGNAPPDQARYWRYPLWQKSTLIVSGRTSVGSSTSIRGAAWGSRFAQDIADYRSVAYDTLNQVQQGRDLTSGVRVIGTQNLSVGSLTLAFNGLTSRHEKGTVRSRQNATPDSTSTFQQHILSIGVEYKAQLSSRITVSAGANVDGADYPQTGPFPERDPFYAWGMTSGLRIEGDGGWTFRGAAGRKSRFPTMRELFGAAIGKFIPNPSLKPVTAWISEVGLERQSGSLDFGATAFLNRVYNTIDKRTFTRKIIESENLPASYLGKEQRINLQGARVYGVETTARWTPSEALTLDGTLTWSRPRGFDNDGNTQRLDEKPSWLGTGTVAYKLPFGLSVTAQGRYTGGVYARNEQNEFVALPSSPSLILDARLSYALPTIADRIEGELYVRGENLTDEAVFIGLGLPRPGRTVRVGVDLTL